MQEEFEDTKWVIAVENRRKTNAAAKEKGQKNEQRSTKHYTEN